MIDKSKREKQLWVFGWIQVILASIAVLFAIPGLIIAYLSFSKSDHDLQIQINKQTEISGKLQTQIEILSKQFNFQIEQYQENTKRRQSDVNPNISLKINYWNWLEQDVYGTFNIIGKPAKFIKCIPSKDNNFEINFGKDFLQGYILSGNLDVIFKVKNKENPILDFTLFYEDIDGKIHSKRFYFNKKDDLFIEPKT